MKSQIDWVQTGRLVAQKRHAAGLTQHDLAERLGLSVRQVSELERGVIKRPSAQIVEAARKWLGRKLPEIGETPPILPIPTPIPLREHVAEAKRQFTILSTTEPTFWVGIAASITEFFHCSNRMREATKSKPRIVRTGRRRHLLNEPDGP